MIGLSVAALLAVAAPTTAPEPTGEGGPRARAHVVIVAHNASADGSLAPLRYADDDGARYAELFGLMSPNVALLSVMDVETQRLHPSLAGVARAPTRAELGRTLDRTFGAIEADNAAGHRTALYFVYVGHGSVGDDGEGAVHLADGHFTRADLYHQILARSPATVNHLVIDACNAYLMVARRGGDAAMEDALQSFLRKEGLDRYPNTGVLLSTSMAKEVHEWSRFSAGIFSHELRSALAGAADVDGDRKVTYAEARAFIAAANARVDNPAARLDVFARAPAIHLDEPLLDRGALREAKAVHVPASRAGRWFLEDERGVRFADFHSAGDEAVTLSVVPQPRYFLRDTRGREIEIPLTVASRVDVGTLAVRDQSLASRGSEAVTFQRDLFALPFGRAYFEGYKGASLPAPRNQAFTAPPDPEVGRTRRYVAYGLGTAGVAALLTGAGFAIAAQSSGNQFQTFVGDDDDLTVIQNDARSQTTTSHVLFGVGGGLVAAAVGLWLWPDD